MKISGLLLVVVVCVVSCYGEIVGIGVAEEYTNFKCPLIEIDTVTGEYNVIRELPDMLLDAGAVNRNNGTYWIDNTGSIYSYDLVSGERLSDVYAGGVIMPDGFIWDGPNLYSIGILPSGDIVLCLLDEDGGCTPITTFSGYIGYTDNAYTWSPANRFYIHSLMFKFGDYTDNYVFIDVDTGKIVREVPAITSEITLAYDDKNDRLLCATDDWWISSINFTTGELTPICKSPKGDPCGAGLTLSEDFSIAYLSTTTKTMSNPTMSAIDLTTCAVLWSVPLPAALFYPGLM
ncbi:hypothetical protein Pelo_17445 [Pelomyxa schiedti]|nr:hypothetical protein Pelo_17445 [Pelomyxa schiedti]